MTDAEIKKGLRCCALNAILNKTCDECLYGNRVFKRARYCTSVLSEDALDFINRQQAEIENYSQNNRSLTEAVTELQKALKKQSAEIERLKKCEIVLEAIEDNINPLPFETDYDKAVKREKAKAIKEFAERLKKISRPTLEYYGVVLESDIDTLVKETAGDAE